MGHGRPADHRVGVDGEVVVLAGDLDTAGADVLHGMVAAVVTERHLARVGADGAAEQLVTEADPEDRHTSEQLAGSPRPGASHIAGSPGPLLRNTPSGWRARISSAVVEAGHDVDGAESRQVVADVALHAEVDGDDATAVRRIERVDRVGGRRGHRADEVDTVGARLAPGGGEQVGLRPGAERAGDRSGLADDAGQPAGVDAGDAGHAVAGEQRVQVALGAVVAVASRQFTDHDAAAERAA